VRGIIFIVFVNDINIRKFQYVNAVVIGLMYHEEFISDQNQWLLFKNRSKRSCNFSDSN